MKGKVLLISFFLLFIFRGYSQENKFKALFVYNFTKYIEWPLSSINDNFIIGVANNNDLFEELKPISVTKKISGIPVLVKELTDTDNPGECQIVVFNSSKKEYLANLVSQTSNKPVLLISDKSGLCSEGAGICFVMKNGNLNFEISRNNISGHSLKVNSQLFNLGTVVD
jgi:hypothetical protein